MANRGVYAIVNTVTWTYYIGSSGNVRKRWADHRTLFNARTHENKHLSAAVAKYGRGAFAFVMVEDVAADADVLAAEQRWLDAAFDVGARVYNWERKAGVPPSRKGAKVVFSAEHRRKLGESSRGRPKSEEQRRKHSEAMTGRKLSPEHVEKIRKTSAGRRHTDESREKLRQAHLGKRLSDETRAKISAAKSAPTPETIEKLRAAARAKSPEERKATGLKLLGRKASPEAVARMCAAQVARRAREHAARVGA